MTDPLARADLGDAAAAARAEWQADEDDWTRAAFERWRHDRTLVDVVRECMHRGDTIALRSAHIMFTGRVEAVGGDLIALAPADGRVDLRVADGVPLVVRVIERARTGGTRGQPVTTFRARLLELEMDEATVEVGVAAADAADVVCGRLDVGRDHVIVRAPGQADTVIALSALAWVRRAPDPSAR